ncbi:hypothetical protein ACHAW6_010644 [Cyclotella cf. meneghiniana]
MTVVALLHATEVVDVKEDAFDFAKILKGIEDVVSDAFSFSTNSSGSVECKEKEDALLIEGDGGCEPIGNGDLSSCCSHEDTSVTTCSVTDLSTTTESKSFKRHVSWFDDEENLCEEHSVEVKYIEINKKTQVKKMLTNWNTKMCLNMKSARKRQQRQIKNIAK